MLLKPFGKRQPLPVTTEQISDRLRAANADFREKPGYFTALAVQHTRAALEDAAAARRAAFRLV